MLSEYVEIRKPRFAGWTKIFRNVLSQFAGTVVTLAVGFFLMPFIVHRIGVTAFGIWMLVNSLVGYMGLLQMGLTPTLVKKSAEILAKGEKEELNRTVTTIFTLYLLSGILAAALIFCLSFSLHQVFNIPSEESDTFKKILWIISLQLLLGFPMSIWPGLLTGLQDYHIRNGITILSNFLKAIATILLLSIGFGLISLILLGFALSVFEWLVSMLWVRRRIPYLCIRVVRFEPARLKDLVSFSGVMFIWGIAGTTIQQADRIIIGLFLPVASVTIYEVGARLSYYSKQLTHSALWILFPAASELNAKAEKSALQTLYLKGTKYLLGAYTGIVVVLLLFGKEFIHLWMGEGFEGSVWIMYVLLIGRLYQSQNVVAHVMLGGIGKLRILAKVMIAYPIINIILSISFVIQWGLIGVALATTFTLAILETYFIFYITKVFETSFLSLLKKCHLSAAISSIPPIVVIYYLKSILIVDSWTRLFLGILLFLATYFLSFWIFGTSRQEKATVKSLAFGMLNQRARF